MLTLTRKVGESIRIGDDIEIVVKEVRRNQIRIGISAPREVPIYREEVYERMQAEATSVGKASGQVLKEKACLTSQSKTQ